MHTLHPEFDHPVMAFRKSRHITGSVAPNYIVREEDAHLPLVLQYFLLFWGVFDVLESDGLSGLNRRIQRVDGGGYLKSKRIFLLHHSYKSVLSGNIKNSP